MGSRETIRATRRLGHPPVTGDLSDPAAIGAVVKETGARAAFVHAPMALGPTRPPPALQALLDAGITNLVFNTGLALPPGPIGNPMLDAQVATIDWLLGTGRATRGRR